MGRKDEQGRDDDLVPLASRESYAGSRGRVRSRRRFFRAQGLPLSTRKGFLTMDLVAKKERGFELKRDQEQSKESQLLAVEDHFETSSRVNLAYHVF